MSRTTSWSAQAGAAGRALVSDRGRRIAVAGVGAAGVAVLAVLLVVMTSSAPRRPIAARSSITAPSAPAMHTNTQNIAPLTAAEQHLVTALHFVDARTCQGLPDQERNGVVAKVVCTPAVGGSGAPASVFVYRLRDAAALRAVETDLYGAGPDFADCNDPPAASTWSNSAGRQLGRLFCGVGDTSGSPVFAWSYDRDLVLADAQAGRANPHADLYRWWISADVDLG